MLAESWGLRRSENSNRKSAICLTRGSKDCRCERDDSRSCNMGRTFRGLDERCRLPSFTMAEVTVRNECSRC